MSKGEQSVENITRVAEQDLKRLIDEMGTKLELTVGEVICFSPFLSKAWIAGAKAVQTEVIARQIEAGRDFPDGLDEGETGKEGEGLQP